MKETLRYNLFSDTLMLPEVTHVQLSLIYDCMPQLLFEYSHANACKTVGMSSLNECTGSVFAAERRHQHQFVEVLLLFESPAGNCGQASRG